MIKNSIVKIFFRVLCLIILATAHQSVAAQRKGNSWITKADLKHHGTTDRDRREAARSAANRKRAEEANRRREIAERRRSEEKRREYARRKRIADKVNKSNKTYIARKRRQPTKRYTPYVYEGRNRREIQVTAIPVQPM